MAAKLISMNTYTVYYTVYTGPTYEARAASMVVTASTEKEACEKASEAIAGKFAIQYAVQINEA